MRKRLLSCAFGKGCRFVRSFYLGISETFVIGCLGNQIREANPHAVAELQQHIHGWVCRAVFDSTNGEPVHSHHEPQLFLGKPAVLPMIAKHLAKICLEA